MSNNYNYIYNIYHNQFILLLIYILYNYDIFSLLIIILYLSEINYAML